MIMNKFEELIEEEQEQENSLNNNFENQINALEDEYDNQTMDSLVQTIASVENRSQRHSMILRVADKLRDLGHIQPSDYNKNVKTIRTDVEEVFRNKQKLEVNTPVSVYEFSDGMYCTTLKGPEKITNAFIAPNYRVYASRESINNRETVDTYGEFTITVPQAGGLLSTSIAEFSSSDFRNALTLTNALKNQKIGSVFIHGSDRSVTYLGDYLFNQTEAVRKTGVSPIGIIEHEGSKIVVTPNQCYDLEGNCIPDVVYHRGAVAPNIIRKYQGLDYDRNTWETIVAPQYISNIIHLHDRAVMLSLVGWSSSIPFESSIRKKAKMSGFPHALLVGVNGGGKSSLAMTLMPYTGYSADSTVPSFSSEFANQAALSSSYHIPAFLDEYRPSAWKEKDRNDRDKLLRESYGRGTYDKGQKSLDTVTLGYCNPILIMGQEAPLDPSLIERLIPIHLNANFINEEELTEEAKRAIETHAILNDAANKHFWTGYMIWCANQDPDEIGQKMEEYTARVIGEFPKLKKREALNYATVLTGLYFFKKLADEYELDCGYNDQDIENTVHILGGQVTTILGEKKDELQAFLEDLDWYISTHGNTRGDIYGEGYTVRLYQPNAGKSDTYGVGKPAEIRGRTVLLVNVPDAIKTIQKECKNTHNGQMLKSIVQTLFEKTQKNNGEGLVLAPDGYRPGTGKRYTAFNWEEVKDRMSSIEKLEEFDLNISSLKTIPDTIEKEGNDELPVQ